MSPKILVEITPGRDGTIPEDLIIRAYAASQREPIVLVLNGIGARLINVILDPIVPTLPLDIPGVFYVDMESGGLAEAFRSATQVFASSMALRSAALIGGVARDQIYPAETAFLAAYHIVSPRRAGSRQYPQSRYSAGLGAR